ncbi:unnamed protein product [Brassica napus]|uniref:(rape) hypothetical protein n=1 Tax=Brassica napus TaxID=3708 RepID=A0A816KGN6_BRANA|nr:unnamed protein product [Brassica napus]
MAKGDEEISGAPSRVYRLVSPLRRLPLRFPDLEAALGPVRPLEVVTGIALPSGSDKLYTASKDETLRIWDCASGQVSIYLPLRIHSIVWLFFNGYLSLFEVSKTDGRVGNTTNVIIGGTVADDSAKDWLVLDQKVLQNDIDINMLNPPTELEKRKHKLKRLVQSPNSFFMRKIEEVGTKGVVSDNRTSTNKVSINFIDTIVR